MPPHQSSFSRSSAPLEFTDDALRTLGSLSNLEVVGISSSQFTNDGVVHLAKLKQLHTLILRGPDKQRNAIDDHGLLLLLDNKLLSDVDVTNTRVTNFAAAKLTNQLPGCRITHGFQ